MRTLSWALVAAWSVLLTGAATAQEVAFTFDDLPAHGVLPPGETRTEVAQQIIAALKAAGLPPVYGFVNGVQDVREPASVPVLPMWRDAGLPLGNHTWSHMNLDTSVLADWEADVLKNESLLRAQMAGGDWRWFRYPYLAEGDTPEKRTAARVFLAQHGYRVAQVTMNFSDYAFNEPYARCTAKGDQATVARLETTYLNAAEDEIQRRRSMSKALYGRDIPYVLLMHIGAFDARMAPRLLALYRSHGFSFVTLQQAEADPFYKPDTDLRDVSAPDTLEAAMEARNIPIPNVGVDTSWLDKACR